MAERKRSVRVVRAAAVVIAAALALSACSATGGARVNVPAQTDGSFSSATTGALSEAVKTAMKLSASSGAVAGVWAPWAGEWTSATGTTTIGGKTPMTEDMRFRIGELTQGMTCTVLLKLVEEGKVTLEEKVSKALPAAPGMGDITLGELCQGTSGLADYGAALAPYVANTPERMWPPLELLAAGQGGVPTGAPGAAYAASDTGFVLLGLALEEVTHRSWNDLYAQYVLGPLALSSTSLPDPSSTKIPGSHASGYIAPRGGDGAVQCDAVHDVSSMSSSFGWTAGGMVSTVDDLKTWTQALATGSLLDASSTKTAWTTIPLGADAPTWEGYGFGATQYGPLRGGSADMGGFMTAAFTEPKSGLTVVVMLNNATAGKGFVQSLALQLASVVSKEPAASGKTAPSFQFPWSADQMVEAMQKGAVCQPAPAG
ncbi:serine hydrolase domain-containing protein [Glaciibacter flavus]|uniref:serine hydrolase domain-containing protein n=1 Tax=Orlajensenia flava TaxID=2565934 RepID=UPI003B007DB2